MEKFKLMADLSDDELGNLPKMAYGCVNNISDENGMLKLLPWDYCKDLPTGSHFACQGNISL